MLSSENKDWKPTKAESLFPIPHLSFPQQNTQQTQRTLLGYQEGTAIFKL